MTTTKRNNTPLYSPECLSALRLILLRSVEKDPVQYEVYTVQIDWYLRRLRYLALTDERYTTDAWTVQILRARG